jgi:hypothetical protein
MEPEIRGDRGQMMPLTNVVLARRGRGKDRLRTEEIEDSETEEKGGRERKWLRIKEVVETEGCLEGGRRQRC